ncbi:MAG: hypothetical protein EOO08_08830 [Chitinophagaceae bacterium]|nr:MAG: hypothetical protein EOO08_08830 [Chitinophagaceae bacterium]
MQTLWSGSIAFGLVNIPVKLHSAVNTEEIKFHSLSKEDHSPIRYKRVAENTGLEVPYKDIVKTYALLQRALEKSELVGVANFPLRQRTHICLLRAYRGRLVLAQLRYAEELRELPSMEENVAVTEKELQLALQLVKQLSAPFDAAKFHDPYVQELKAIIEAKARGRKLKATPASAPKDAGVKDLMEVLKASIGQKKQKRA